MEYVAVGLTVVAAIAISTAYYLYEIYADMRIINNRCEWLANEVQVLRTQLSVTRREQIRHNESTRPTKKVTPRTLNSRRKDNQ